MAHDKLHYAKFMNFALDFMHFLLLSLTLNPLVQHYNALTFSLSGLKFVCFQDLDFELDF